MLINGKLSAPPAPQLAQARARGGFRSGAAPAPIPTLVRLEPPCNLNIAHHPTSCLYIIRFYASVLS